MLFHLSNPVVKGPVRRGGPCSRRCKKRDMVGIKGIGGGEDQLLLHMEPGMELEVNTLRYGPRWRVLVSMGGAR